MRSGESIVLVLLVAPFLYGAVSNAFRFVNSGGKPSHAIGMMLFGVLALISGWVAFVALTGAPFP